MSAGILVRLRESSAELTDTERRVADFVANQPFDAMQLSITELARAAAVSEATVVRMCKKLNLKGYPDLRLALAQEVGDSRVREIHADVDIADDIGAVVRKVFAGASRALTDTLSIVDEDVLERAIELLTESRSISFFGQGASGAVARDAYYRFMKLGFNCYALTDSASQLTRVATMGEGDALIVISHSGRSRDLIQAAGAARARGAAVIGITQYGTQPLVDVCDVALFTSSSETAFRSEAMASRIAQHALLDSLWVGLSLKRYEQAVTNLESARELTDSLRTPHPGRSSNNHPH